MIKKSAQASATPAKTSAAFLFLNDLLLLLSASGIAPCGSRGRRAATRAASASAATSPELEEIVDVLALAHLREERREERVDLPAGGLDQSVEVLLGDVNFGVLADHGGVGAEELVLLGLRHLVRGDGRHSRSRSRGCERACVTRAGLEP